MFCNKGVLKNLAKFTGKHLCQCLFLNEVTSLRPATLLKKLWHRCFPVNFAKFLRPVFYRTPPLVVSDLQSEGILVTRDVFTCIYLANTLNQTFSTATVQRKKLRSNKCVFLQIFYRFFGFFSLFFSENDRYFFKLVF